jgi:hypothetical protein
MCPTTLRASAIVLVFGYAERMLRGIDRRRRDPHATGSPLATSLGALAVLRAPNDTPQGDRFACPVHPAVLGLPAIGIRHPTDAMVGGARLIRAAILRPLAILSGTGDARSPRCAAEPVPCAIGIGTASRVGLAPRVRPGKRQRARGDNGEPGSPDRGTCTACAVALEVEGCGQPISRCTGRAAGQAPVGAGLLDLDLGARPTHAKSASESLPRAPSRRFSDVL